MDQTSPPSSIQEQIWGAIDPLGEIRSFMEAVNPGDAGESWTAALGRELGAEWERIAQTGAAFRSVLRDIEGAFTVLVPRGWAVMGMDTAVIRRALQLVSEGRGDEADAELALQWRNEGSWRIKQVCARVQTMAVDDPEMGPLYKERARLLRLAATHHENSRYEASIPLIHAQIEGIAADVTEGKKFFSASEKWRADVVDPRLLVSVASGLAALQSTYGASVHTTQADGSLSRHGIAHGRELAYDIEINSAKSWSVLDALVEWAQPRMQHLTERRRTSREEENAGSSALDSQGRRIDQREFRETKSVLHLLANSAMGWHRRLGHFRTDLVGAVYDTTDFTKRGLPLVHGVDQHVAGSGDSAFYWRETTSGWVLGKGIHYRDGNFFESYYAGPTPPVNFVMEETWEVAGVLPDWS